MNLHKRLLEQQEKISKIKMEQNNFKATIEDGIKRKTIKHEISLPSLPSPPLPSRLLFLGNRLRLNLGGGNGSIPKTL